MERRKARYLANIGLVLVVVSLFGLCYVTYHVAVGLRAPGRRAEVAGRVLDFRIPEGYYLSAAVHMVFTKFAVLANPKTGQRIKISPIRWGRERKADGFRRMYFHPGKRIKRWRHLGGFDAIVVKATREIRAGGQRLPGIAGRFEPGDEEGEMFLYRAAGDGRSFVVVASASSEAYSMQETHDFLRSLLE